MDNYVSYHDLIRLVEGFAALIGLSIFLYQEFYFLKWVQSLIR